MALRTRLRALRLVPARAWAAGALALLSAGVALAAILLAHRGAGKAPAA